MFLGIIGMVVLGSFTTSDPVSDIESVPTTTEVPSIGATQSRQVDIHTPVPTTDSAASPISVATPPASTQPPAPTPAAQERNITPVADREVAEDTAAGSQQTQPTPASGQESQSRGLATPEKVPSTPEAISTIASPVSVQPTPSIQPPFKLEWETSGEYASETSARVDWAFTLGVRIYDVQQAGEHGGISVSFPSLTEPGGSKERHSSSIADVETMDYTSGLSKITFHQPETMIYHRDNNRKFSAEYLLVESDDPSWSTSDDRTLQIRIMPKIVGDFPVQIRGWICADEYTDCLRQPEFGVVEDQQGWFVERAEIFVHYMVHEFHEDPNTTPSSSSFDAASVLARFSTSDPSEGEARADAAGRIIALYRSGDTDANRVLDLLHTMAPELSIEERRRAWDQLKLLSKDDEWDELEAASAVFYLGAIITGDEPNPEERIEAAQEIVALYEAGELDSETALDLMNIIAPDLSINERRQAAAALARLSTDDDWDDADRMEAASEVFRLVTGVPLNAEQRLGAAVDLAGIGVRVFSAEGQLDDRDVEVAAEIIKLSVAGELTNETLRDILKSGY